MAVMTFLNLPVRDLPRSRAFFAALGLSFNEQFSDDRAACLVFNEGSYAMLLTEPHFSTFTTKEIADTGTSAEQITALAVESRQRVDELADAALANGGGPAKEPQDLGFMYSRSFQDPDGHLWEVLFMDVEAAQAVEAP